MIRFLILSCLLLAGACGSGFKDESKTKPNRYVDPVVGPESLLFNEHYLQLLNQHRAKLGLRGLVYNQDVEEVAFTHSRGMGLYSRPLGHSAMSLRCRWLRDRLGLRRGHLCGEVVAKGHTTAKALLAAWLQSPEHREALEAPEYTHTALGVYKNRQGTFFFTQMLIKL